MLSWPPALDEPGEAPEPAPRNVLEEDALDRLLREAMLASALNHPNIVTIYETGVFERDRYVAMELVEGATLRKVFQSSDLMAKVEMEPNFEGRQVVMVLAPR